jgi:hypothetical protein
MKETSSPHSETASRSSRKGFYNLNIIVGGKSEYFKNTVSSLFSVSVKVGGMHSIRSTAQFSILSLHVAFDLHYVAVPTLIGKGAG